MFKYIKFAELPVIDQDRALSFYTNKVGFRVAQDAPYQDDWRWIELEVADNSTKILFSKKDDENFVDAPKLNLVVEDVKAAYEMLKTNGIDFMQEPTEAPWSPGNTFALFRDSENNSILIGND